MSDTSEVKKLGNELVHFLLIASGKHGRIKDRDLAGFWKKNLVSGVELKKEVVEFAEKALEEIFGFQLISIGETDQRKRELVLHNKFAHPLQLEEDECSIEEMEDAKRGLLLLILSYIFMRQPQQNAAVPERELNGFLKNFGVEFGKTLKHSTFGDLDKLLLCRNPRAHGEFVQQGWLSVGTAPGVDHGDMDFEVGWGPRANEILNKKHLLQFVSKIYGCEPEEWGMHLAQAAMAEEKD